MECKRWYTITGNDGAGDNYWVRNVSRKTAWERAFGDWTPRHEFRPFIQEGRKGNKPPDHRIYS